MSFPCDKKSVSKQDKLAFCEKRVLHVMYGGEVHPNATVQPNQLNSSYKTNTPPEGRSGWTGLPRGTISGCSLWIFSLSAEEQLTQGRGRQRHFNNPRRCQLVWSCKASSSFPAPCPSLPSELQIITHVNLGFKDRDRIWSTLAPSNVYLIRC